MIRRTRGTRRAGRLALLLWGVLLWGAAETGGALAPPCADATPFITVDTESIKPIGDPDTPDEGQPKNRVTAVSSVSPAGSLVGLGAHPAARASARGAGKSLREWLRELLDFLQLD